VQVSNTDKKVTTDSKKIKPLELPKGNCIQSPFTSALEMKRIYIYVLHTGLACSKSTKTYISTDNKQSRQRSEAFSPCAASPRKKIRPTISVIDSLSISKSLQRQHYFFSILI